MPIISNLCRFTNFLADKTRDYVIKAFACEIKFRFYYVSRVPDFVLCKSLIRFF